MRKISKEVITNLNNISFEQLYYLANKKIKYKLEQDQRQHEYSLPDEQFIRQFQCTSIDEFIELCTLNYQQKFFINPCEKEQLIIPYKKYFNKKIKGIISHSNEYVNHVFDLLGSGKIDLGDKIDWHSDFKSKYRWNDKKQYIGTRDHVNIDDSSDVKVPWELSRCQHFTTLGKAYWLTLDEQYAQEFVHEIEDWIAENPIGLGVNWACPMDVAIRAVNWIWGLGFFMTSERLTKDFKFMIFKQLYYHGKFIFENLEWNAIRGNHFLADIAGLVYICTVLPKSKEISKWMNLSQRALLSEVAYQINEEGVDFEASINYHRLVTELILSMMLLFQKNNLPIPKIIDERLEKMIEFIMYYTKPDGTCPIIGDTDNGRLQILSDNEVNDHRYLLSIGSVLFSRGDFKHVSGLFNEQAFWLLGNHSLNSLKKLPETDTSISSKSYQDSGYFIMRKDNQYMIIRCGDVGLSGHGGHGHCDCLSFELFVNDKAFIIDPGSYVYTADSDMRHLFRSTRYHNTVMIDNEEINRFEKEKPFEMTPDAQPVLHQWKTTDDYDLFDGMHNGYSRLDNPVTHRRKIQFNKNDKNWIVTDILSGSGTHQFEWNFHFAPLHVEKDKRNSLLIRTKSSGANIEIVPLKPPFKLHCDIHDGWISPSYGIKKRAPILRYKMSKNIEENDLTIKFRIKVLGKA